MTSKFLNKRIYQKDVIEDWIKKGAKKIKVSWPEDCISQGSTLIN